MEARRLPPNKRWGSQLAVDLTRSLAHKPRVCCGFWQKCATLWLLSELSARRGRYWSRKPSLVKSGLILQMQSAGPCHRRCVGEGKCELLPVAMHMRVYVPLFVLLSVRVCVRARVCGCISACACGECVRRGTEQEKSE